MPPQQVQEPGVVRLVHSGKTGPSEASACSWEPKPPKQPLAPLFTPWAPSALDAATPTLREAKPQRASKGLAVSPWWNLD